jgi:hypothetical protein
MKFLSQINVNTEYTLPMVDGTNGQVLSTDGSGVAYWGTISVGSLPLDGLSDVIITSPSSDQMLRYGLRQGDTVPVWHNFTPNFLTPSSSIDALNDVTITSAATGQVLQWSGSAWVNATVTSAGYVSKVQHEVKAGVAITKGQALYVTGADGTNMVVGKASNVSEAMSSKTIGLAAASAAVNGKFFVITEGLIDGLNTSSAEAGDAVWLGVDGALIFGLTNKPVAPAHLVYIGVVTRKNANNGEIFVSVQNGFELNELHDVLINGVSAGQLIRRDSDGLWKNWTPNFLTSLPAHNHNDIYYTESEIDSLFAGETEIDGYNRGAWDVAYNDKINSASFSTTTGVLTLTQQDTGTVTVDLDGRYLESYTETDPTVPSHVKSITATNISNWNDAVNDSIRSASFNTSNGVLTLTQVDLGTVTVDLDGRYITSETDSQTLTWTKATSSIAISNGNSVTLEGLATETFVQSQGYITGISFANVSSKPTTIAGYGITDAITTANIGSQSVLYADSSGNSNLLKSLGSYVWSSSTNGRDFQQGLQVSFVSNNEGYQSYGSVVRVHTYPNDGASAELYFPYSEQYGGNSMQYRLGLYPNAGWSSWKTVVDSENIGEYALTSLPAHNHDDRYYTETESDARYPLSRGTLGTTTNVGDATGFGNNLASGTYTRNYVGHSGQVWVSHDTGGSTGNFALEVTYYGAMYVHTNVDSSSWVTKQIWTSDTFANNSSNWNTAFGWGNHAGANYIVRGSTQSPGSWPEATKFQSSGDIGTETSSAHSLQIYSAEGNDAFMAFHISNDFAVFFGLDNTTNRLYTGGWSDGNNKYQLWDSRDFTSTNVSNWNTAYNDRISSATVTGTTTKTLTLTQGDGGTVTASWTDYDTDNDAQQLTWDKPSITLSISNGNSIALEGLATEEFVASQGYITGSYLPLSGGTLSGAVVVNLGNVSSDTVAFKVGGPANYDSLTIGMEDTPDYDAFIASFGNDIRFYSGKGVATENHSFYWFTSKAGTAQHSVVAMQLDHNQNLTIGGTFTEQSSIRYKENVKSIPSVSQKVEKLDAVSYNKIGNKEEEIGLIAEDVAELFPEVVKYDNEGRPDGVNYSRLSVILLKAVQELTERVNKLENK